MGTPCGASASGTSEFGSSDVVAMSSMLSAFGSAEERMKMYNNIYKQHLTDEDRVECKSEFDQYLLKASVDLETKGFDILDQWRVNSSRYSVLSQVARDVLAIPISTIASKFAFSTGGHVLDPFCNSLSPNTVEALICTQNWLRSKDSTEPINLRQAMDEVENYELESSNMFMFFSNFFLLLLFINSLVFFLIYLIVSYYLYTICFFPPFQSLHQNPLWVKILFQTDLKGGVVDCYESGDKFGVVFLWLKLDKERLS